MKLCISPCPNDTFMFHALVHGAVRCEGVEFETEFADIEELNRRAMAGAADVCKVSCAVLPRLAGKYRVLDAGAALGRGNGPLLVAAREVDPRDAGLKIALPGEHTTAKLLVDRLFPQLTDRHYVLFSEVAPRVASGEFDAGVLIHEGRFTYAEAGLRLVADLGREWERTTGSPLPLGAIVVREGIDRALQHRIGQAVRASVRHAMAHPGASQEFVAGHARELSREVREAHIALFVNEFSVELGAGGRAAVCALTGMQENDLFLG